MLEYIVLDLDECLVRMFTNKVNWDLYETLLRPEHFDKRNEIFQISDSNGMYWGLKRPYLTEFLEFCFMKFKVVAVWSAGITDYVEAIVKHIFRDTQNPHLILTRTHIVYGLGSSYSKPLEVFFQYMEGADKTNTLLVDNQHSNSLYDPYNIIHIPHFKPKQNLTDIYQADAQLQVLMHWFRNIDNKIHDVRDLPKQDIFPKHAEKGK